MSARLTPYAVPLGVATARGPAPTRSGWWIEAGGGVGEIAPWPGFGAGRAAVEAALAGPIADAPVDAVEEVAHRAAGLP
ncbi:MAG: hypothetical protein H6706_28250 [Myxococcales bacterium]|nr:hypothetical protein [Myxococcales bacterium]